MNKMTYKGYTAHMEFDTEDKIIVGRVIDIDDIITFHGTSIVEFETAMHAAVDGYLFACEQLGQAAEKPASGRLMLRIDPAVHAAAAKASARGLGFARLTKVSRNRQNMVYPPSLTNNQQPIKTSGGGARGPVNG